MLSNSQAVPGRKVKQEQEEISRNHVHAFIPGSVVMDPSSGREGERRVHSTQKPDVVGFRFAQVIVLGNENYCT